MPVVPAVNAIIQRVELLAGELYRAALTVPESYGFEAGQYLLIGSNALPLSIASTPKDLPHLQLLFKSDGSKTAEALRSELQGSQIQVSTAAGDVTRQHSRPIAVIAAGTGVSQGLSLCAEDGTLYWAHGALDPNLLPKSLAGRSWLTADVSLGADNALQRRLAADAKSLRGQDVVISGAPGFVYQCVDTLSAAGIDESRMRSDVFAYAPR